MSPVFGTSTVRYFNQQVQIKNNLKGKWIKGALLFIGLIWFLCELLKDVSIRPVPPGTDYRQAYIDSHKGVSGKTLDRRMSNGYYVKKK